MRDVTLRVMTSVLTQPLLDGEVTIPGVPLRAQAAESIDQNSRDMLTLAFDVGEMAVATFLKAREQGLPVAALPIFTSGRRFLQAGFALSGESGMQSLSDLRGKTVAVPQYWMSSAVWQRQILRDVYGVDAADVQWVSTQPERMEQLRVPEGVHLRLDETGRNPRELLDQGVVDAALTPGGGREQVASDGPGRAQPAFPDVRAAEREYYQRTGIFPIMHVTVVKEALVAEYPPLVRSLQDAYDRAKSLARQREVVKSSPSPGAGQTTRELQELLGDDPWPYGQAANRKALEALVTAAYDQGMLDRPTSVGDLFAAGAAERVA